MGQTEPGGTLATRTVRAIVNGAGGTLYAGVDDPVDAASGGVYQSTDGGDTGTEIGGTTLTNKKMLALAFDGITLYAGTREETVGSTTFTGGVFAWNGSTWTNSINGGVPTQSARRV